MKNITLTIFLILGFINNSYSSVSILNGLSHLYSGKSGDIIQGEVVLLNTSDIPQRVSFKLNEAIFSCEADRVFIEKFQHASSSSLWFNGETLEKVFAPKEKYTFKFSIKIPNEDTLQGAFWTVLMISVDNPIKEEQLEKNIGLDTKIRYAVGLLTQVNELDRVDLEFNEMEVFNSLVTLKKNLKIKMQNLGKFIEPVSLTMEIYNQDGEKIKEFVTDRNLIFPNSCKEYIIDISMLPIGEYDCILLADSREAFIGSNISLTIE